MTRRIEDIKKLMALAVKTDQPRQELVDRLLRHIAESDSLGFIETYDNERPTAGEMLRVVARYTKAMRALRDAHANSSKSGSDC